MAVGFGRWVTTSFSGVEGHTSVRLYTCGAVAVGVLDGGLFMVIGQTVGIHLRYGVLECVRYNAY